MESRPQNPEFRNNPEIFHPYMFNSFQLITFANSLDPDEDRQMSVLVWIQSVWHSDSVPEFFLNKVNFGKLYVNKSMTIYRACKELKLVFSF